MFRLIKALFREIYERGSLVNKLGRMTGAFNNGYLKKYIVHIILRRIS